jgi:hypothetical protein
MDFVKAGKVVKFIDENGEKNAGTVVEIVKQQGIKKAVINTIEGKTIVKNLKNLKDLYLVKNEVRGKRSISVLKEVAEELGKEVVETKIPKKDSYLVVGDKVLKPLKNPNEGESENTIDKDEVIKDLEFKVLSLEQQLSSSKEQINDLEKMKVSIIHLAKALKVRTTESGESKTINELLTCILELNNLGELVVD